MNAVCTKILPDPFRLPMTQYIRLRRGKIKSDGTGNHISFTSNHICVTYVHDARCIRRSDKPATIFLSLKISSRPADQAPVWPFELLPDENSSGRASQPSIVRYCKPYFFHFRWSQRATAFLSRFGVGLGAVVRQLSKQAKLGWADQQPAA